MMACLRLPIVASPTMKLTPLSTAPAYMSFTAVRMDGGAGGRCCGTWSNPLVGYG